METIVAYNAGKAAALAGGARHVPETIPYPILSRYESYRKVDVALGHYAQSEWLAGYDAIVAARATKALGR